MIFNKDLELNSGEIVLRPLAEIHFESLIKLASDKRIWEYAPECFFDPVVFRERWLNKAMRSREKGERQCLVIFNQGQLVGSSSYYEIDEPNKKLIIGYTWFHPDVWGTYVNPLTKLIMLSYAFEMLHCNRVGFCVDAINERSCRAVKKIGAKQEGILRNHMVLANGRVRDTVVFSIICDEWVEIKRQLEKRVNI